MSGRQGGRDNNGPPSLPAEERSVFREAVRDTKPLRASGRVVFSPQRRKPVPYPTLQDERQPLVDSLSDPIWDRDDPETGEEHRFLRPGLSRQVLRRLRRGHWAVQDELDLHGMTSVEARRCLAEFLGHCKDRGLRCVRIIHGKGLGSINREPVLKHKVKHWLMQRDEILAYCQAKPVDGGGGATVVLLKGSK